MKLSEQLRAFRADRPDEWTMDNFIRCAENLENRLQFLMETTDIDGDSYRVAENVINQID